MAKYKLSNKEYETLQNSLALSLQALRLGLVEGLDNRAGMHEIIAVSLVLDKQKMKAERHRLPKPK